MEKTINKIILLCFLVFPLNALAGNITQNVLPFGGGERTPIQYKQNVKVLFDKDFNGTLIEDTINKFNNELVDIQLEPEISTKDYNHALDVFRIFPFRDLRYKRNRIFVFLGRGFSPNFAASTRQYSDGTPTSFIHLRKDQFELASFRVQQEILIHELLHSLGFDHNSANKYTGGIDYFTQDDLDPLYRVYDSGNSKNLTSAQFENTSKAIVTFIPRKKSLRTYTVATIDDSVKLKPGIYRVKVDDFYICNRKGTLCGNWKKAKLFKFKKNKNRTILVNKPS